MLVIRSACMELYLTADGTKPAAMVGSGGIYTSTKSSIWQRALTTH
jgi:hypothetical protein